MKETLLDKVKLEKLDVLLDALADVMGEMKSLTPRSELLKVEGYLLCLGIWEMMFGAMRKQVIRNIEIIRNIEAKGLEEG